MVALALWLACVASVLAAASAAPVAVAGPAQAQAASAEPSLRCSVEHVYHQDQTNKSNSATIERDRCTLSFPSSSCTVWRRTRDADLATAAIESASKPHAKVVVVKLGAMSPFQGDRASNLNRLVMEVARRGDYRIVLLMDTSSLEGTQAKALDALPPHLRPLLTPYTKAQIEKTFPTRKLPGKLKVRVHCTWGGRKARVAFGFIQALAGPTPAAAPASSTLVAPSCSRPAPNPRCERAP